MISEQGWDAQIMSEVSKNAFKSSDGLFKRKRKYEKTALRVITHRLRTGGSMEKTHSEL